jgi:hypothetical protein
MMSPTEMHMGELSVHYVYEQYGKYMIITIHGGSHVVQTSSGYSSSIFKVGLSFLLHVAELRYCTEMPIVADHSAEMEGGVQH